MVKNVISVIDGEAGSCGKAKVVWEIATDNILILVLILLILIQMQDLHFD